MDIPHDDMLYHCLKSMKETYMNEAYITIYESDWIASYKSFTGAEPTDNDIKSSVIEYIKSACGKDDNDKFAGYLTTLTMFEWKNFKDRKFIPREPQIKNGVVC